MKQTYYIFALLFVSGSLNAQQKMRQRKPHPILATNITLATSLALLTFARPPVYGAVQTEPYNGVMHGDTIVTANQNIHSSEEQSLCTESERLTKLAQELGVLKCTRETTIQKCYCPPVNVMELLYITCTCVCCCAGMTSECAEECRRR